MNPAKPLLTFGMVLACVSLAALGANPPAKTPAKTPAAPAKGPATRPAATAPAGKQQQRVGNILFRPPTGWEVTEKEKERIAVLNPPGETPKTASVVLVSGERPPGGDFLKWFGEKWGKLCQGLTPVQERDVEAQQSRAGVDILYQQALLRDADKNMTGVLLYAAKVGDGVEWAVFQTAGAERFNKYNKTVSGMLASLKFERKEVQADQQLPDDPVITDNPKKPAGKRGSAQPGDPPPDFVPDRARIKAGN